VHAGEQVIDLALIDKSLLSYQYQPTVKGVSPVHVEVNGMQRSYYIYIPDNKYNLNMPVLVALHGAGRTGLSMIDTWQRLADEKKFVVIAPNGLNKNWNIARDEAKLVGAALSKVLKTKNIDKERVYLFGHSNGGKQAISQAVRYPNHYKKVALHAASLPLMSYQQPELPVNNLKIGFFLGDSDRIFSVQSARDTASWLASLDVESDLYILKYHTHWYYSDAYRINKTIWNYLVAH